MSSSSEFVARYEANAKRVSEAAVAVSMSADLVEESFKRVRLVDAEYEAWVADGRPLKPVTWRDYAGELSIVAVGFFLGIIATLAVIYGTHLFGHI